MSTWIIVSLVSIVLAGLGIALTFVSKLRPIRILSAALIVVGTIGFLFGVWGIFALLF